MANTQKKMVSPIGSIYWCISVVSGCVFRGKPRRTIKMICSAKRIPRCECCEASTPGTGHEGWKPGGLVNARWVCCFEKECFGRITLLGTNISLTKALLKIISLFLRWDMFVSWRIMKLFFITMILLLEIFLKFWNVSPYPESIPDDRFTSHQNHVFS